MKKIICILISFFLLFYSLGVVYVFAADEEITLGMYYPSPSGLYDSIRAMDRTTVIRDLRMFGTLTSSSTQITTIPPRVTIATSALDINHEAPYFTRHLQSGDLKVNNPDSKIPRWVIDSDFGILDYAVLFFRPTSPFNIVTCYQPLVGINGVINSIVGKSGVTNVCGCIPLEVVYICFCAGVESSAYAHTCVNFIDSN